VTLSKAFYDHTRNVIEKRNIFWRFIFYSISFPFSFSLGVLGSLAGLPLAIVFGIPYFIFKQLSDKSKIKEQSRANLEKRYQMAQEIQAEIENIKNKHNGNI
jgi:hypothetical protein